MNNRTIWNRVRSMSDREILRATSFHPDAQPLTDAELKGFKRVQSLFKEWELTILDLE